ncbi:MAG: MFS transporter [Candidatus Uhrbacteria bacterium]|nr:MFS transporter [Candidatus Uhrbacteria bacterium]
MRSKLEGNILKYNYYKIFSKRVFLPLIAIFLIDQGGVTLPQIAFIASITAIAQFMVEIPSGYIADRWGHKRSLTLSAFLCAISVLPYIFFPGFIGGLLAFTLFFSGGAFASGTLQAFMHETLLELGRDREYSEIMGKGQSFGLIGNIALVSLIPLTYVIHPRIPFILGFLCLFIAFLIVLSFVEPLVRVPVAEEGYKRGTIEKLRLLAKKVPFLRMFLVFLFFGIVSASSDQTSLYREVIFRDVGIPVESFGFILAFGSLLAAIVGRYIHHLKKLSPYSFYIFDAAYFVLAYILIGITHSPLMLVIAFSLFPAYGRTRDIIFESQVFEEFPYSNYKATMISTMNFFGLLNSVWAPLLLALIIGQSDLITGHLYFGLVIGLILSPIIFFQKFVSRGKLEANLT